MKLFLDFLPIILFFGVFKIADMHPDIAAQFATEHLGFAVSGHVVGGDEAPVLLATLVVMVATLVQIAITLAMRKKVDTMLWVTFGLIVGLSGCLRGLQAERSAGGVGRAATSAVVTAILLIIIADAIYAGLFNALGL